MSTFLPVRRVTMLRTLTVLLCAGFLMGAAAGEGGSCDAHGKKEAAACCKSDSKCRKDLDKCKMACKEDAACAKKCEDECKATCKSKCKKECKAECKKDGALQCPSSDKNTEEPQK
jgi:hypothetical protein